MEENITVFWYENDYLVVKRDNVSTYYSKKDRNELGYYEEKMNTLFLNDEFKGRYKKQYGQIKKKHKDAKLSEYLPLYLPF